MRWLLAAVAALVAMPAGACTLPRADQVWADAALANWRFVEARFLHLPPVPPPTVVMIGADCVAERAGSRWSYRPHRGEVTLPDGKRVPAGVMSFAAPAAGGARAFFAMSTPAVWRAGGVKGAPDVETLMDGVLLHEMMHTRQHGFVTAYLDGLTKQYGLAEDVNDDSLQEAFAGDPAYVAAYEAERDLLFAAAAAPTDNEARVLAGRALAMMRERRARWFTGANEKWAALDDLFLQMEGLGQWVIWKWSLDGPRRTMAPGAGLAAVRRGGRWWSQDEGLALMLVVDRLVPDWQAHAFAERPDLAQALLSRAAGVG